MALTPSTMSRPEHERPGTLYVVATPLGNLGDISRRALEVLGAVDQVAAEDTRHSARLLQHFGIATPLFPLHDFNEERGAAQVIERLRHGQDIALISDAGTPLISDPGYRLVRAARQAGLAVVPVPGPSALTAALSVAGLATDRFAFEGFLPAKASARQSRLAALAGEPRTLVFYEAPHRILDSVRDLVAVFGAQREAVLARELTKTFESIHGAPLGELPDWLLQDVNRQRGEFVVLVEGAPPRAAGEVDEEAERILVILLEDLPLKQAAALAARITGLRRNALYEHGLGLQGARGGARPPR